jgi:hypothetical protein
MYSRVLPILIISKNIVHSLLFQIPEWNEDWNEWNKEIHIKCTYDGTEVWRRNYRNNGLGMVFKSKPLSKDARRILVSMAILEWQKP